MLLLYFIAVGYTLALICPTIAFAVGCTSDPGDTCENAPAWYVQRLVVDDLLRPALTCAADGHTTTAAIADAEITVDVAIAINSVFFI